MIPEQRVLRIARIGPEQVANVTASDQEITAYYNQNKATYAPSDTRSLTQALAQDQATANAIAGQAKGGQPLASAAGANAAVTELKDQTRAAYAGVSGDKAAEAVFSAAQGAVVGPIKTDFGWAVVKVNSVKAGGGKTLEQARAEIAAKLTADKRKGAIEDLVDKVQNALDEGSNFNEAVGAAKLPVTNTPLITASGASRTDAAYKLPAELAPVLKTGFEIAPNDPPEVVSLPDDAGYAIVSPGEIVPAAPSPLASIRAKVTIDWINSEATKRAEADVAAQAETFRLRARVADEDRARDGGEGERQRERVAVAGEHEPDRPEHRGLADPIGRRVEEGPERRGLAARTCEGAVEDVQDRPDDEDDRAGPVEEPRVAVLEEHKDRRGQAQRDPGRGQRVRRDARPGEADDRA
jgi:hypothetical protein